MMNKKATAGWRGWRRLAWLRRGHLALAGIEAINGPEARATHCRVRSAWAVAEALSGREARATQCRVRAASVVMMVLLLCGAGMSGGTCADLALWPWAHENDSARRSRDDYAIYRRPVILNSDHVLGDRDAPLVVVEYEDYQSANCGRFARTELPIVRAKYIDTGLVCWVFRHYPLDSNTRALPAARAAECAADAGLFFEYRDLVYQTTDADAGALLDDETLGQHAESLGLDRTAFDDCFQGERKTARVNQDANSGTALGVQGVPMFFVGAESLTGFRTAEELGETIDRHLAGN